MIKISNPGNYEKQYLDFINWLKFLNKGKKFYVAVCLLQSLNYFIELILNLDLFRS